MAQRGLTRRAALGGLVALSTGAGTACRPFGGGPAEPKPDEVVRQRVLASKWALLDRYTATLERHPGLQARLDPLMAEHRTHLSALNAAPSGTPAPGSPASPAPEVPATEHAALWALAAAERRAADGRVTDVLAATPRLARVLASIGGCEAGHAELLGGAGGSRR
jgi:hypothetical protein